MIRLSVLLAVCSYVKKNSRHACGVHFNSHIGGSLSSGRTIRRFRLLPPPKCQFSRAKGNPIPWSCCIFCTACFASGAWNLNATLRGANPVSRSTTSYDVHPDAAAPPSAILYLKQYILDVSRSTVH